MKQPNRAGILHSKATAARVDLRSDAQTSEGSPRCEQCCKGSASGWQRVERPSQLFECPCHGDSFLGWLGDNVRIEAAHPLPLPTHSWRRARESRSARWVYETPIITANTVVTSNTIVNGTANYSDAALVSYYVFTCAALCFYIITIVYAALVSGFSATYALTSGDPQAMRQAVLMVRQDRRYVIVIFIFGVVCMLLALSIQYATPGVILGQLVTNLLILILTLLVIGGMTLRVKHRYPYDEQDHAMVSGDDFLMMGTRESTDPSEGRSQQSH